MKKLGTNAIFFLYSLGISCAIYIAYKNFNSEEMFKKNFYIFLFSAIAIFYSEVLGSILKFSSLPNFFNLFNETKLKLSAVLNLFILPAIYTLSILTFAISIKNDLLIIIILLINLVILYKYFHLIKASVEKRQSENILYSEIYDFVNIFSVFIFSYSLFERFDASKYQVIWVGFFSLVLFVNASAAIVKLSIDDLKKSFGIGLLVVLILGVFIAIEYFGLIGITPLILSLYLAYIYYTFISLIQIYSEKGLIEKSLAFKYLCIIGVFTVIIVLLNNY